MKKIDSSTLYHPINASRKKTIFTVRLRFKGSAQTALEWRNVPKIDVWESNQILPARMESLAASFRIYLPVDWTLHFRFPLTTYHLRTFLLQFFYAQPLSFELRTWNSWNRQSVKTFCFIIQRLRHESRRKNCMQFLEKTKLSTAAKIRPFKDDGWKRLVYNGGSHVWLGSLTLCVWNLLETLPSNETLSSLLSWQTFWKLSI